MHVEMMLQDVSKCVGTELWVNLPSEPYAIRAVEASILGVS